MHRPGFRGGAPAGGADYWGIRRVPRDAGLGLEDLSRAFDNNKYSVASRAVGRPVEIQAYGDRIAIRQDGAILGEHQRRFGRGATIYDP